MKSGKWLFILLALYMYIFQQHIQIKPTFKNALLFCGAGGILGGLFGVGGPPIVLYFLDWPTARKPI